MIKGAIAIMLMSVALLAVTGCNTIEGVGRDVSSAGKAVGRRQIAANVMVRRWRIDERPDGFRPSRAFRFCADAR